MSRFRLGRYLYLNESVKGFVVALLVSQVHDKWCPCMLLLSLHVRKLVVIRKMYHFTFMYDNPVCFGR